MAYEGVDFLQNKFNRRIEEAGNDPKKIVEALRELSNDRYYAMKRYVAAYPDCPGYLLDELFNELVYGNGYCDMHAIAFIIMNPNCPLNKIVDYFLFYLTDNHSAGWMFKEIFAKMKSLIVEQKLSDLSLEKLLKMEFTYATGHVEHVEITLGIYNRAKMELARRKRKNYHILDSDLEVPKTVEEKQLELIAQKKAEDERKAKIMELRKKILECLQKLAEFSSLLEEYNQIDGFVPTSKQRIQIPESELLITVDDHIEINPVYLEYIPFVDFSMLSTNNLKVSGIDWSKTNIRIDPQIVYNKDLSHAKFADHNIVFKSFENCNLSGCDISEETESYGIEYAVVDEETKVPSNSINNMTR